jgi:hypothetical protein
MLILILILLNLAFFWRTLKFKHCIDDWEGRRCGCKEPEYYLRPAMQSGKIVHIETCKKCEKQKQGFTPKGHWQLMLWNIIGVYTTHPKVAHASTLAIHTINVVLIYWAFGHNMFSFMVAALFSVHAVATQGSSVWLAGKSYAMGLMAALGMFIFAPLTPLVYSMAILPLPWLWGLKFSSSVITGPLIFLGLDKWIWVLIMPVSFVLAVIWEHRYTGFHSWKDLITLQSLRPLYWKFDQASKVANIKIFSLANVQMVFKTIGYYFSMCVWPTRLGIHHTYMDHFGVSDEDNKRWGKPDRFFWLGILLTCALPALFYFHIPAAFGLFWFFVFILPWANIIRVSQVVAERYCVISLVGVMYMLVSIAMMLPDKWQYAFLAVFFAYYVFRTNEYLRIYENILSCVEENCRNHPDSIMAWQYRAKIEHNLGMRRQEFESYLRAWAIRPNSFQINYTLAQLLAGQGNFKEAKKFLGIAARCPFFGYEKVRDARVKQLAEKMNAAETEIQSRHKQGRNELCACGSGKKFKHCCGQ